jgi:hypothetical protein
MPVFCSSQPHRPVTAIATQTLTVGRDARGVVQLTGSHNVIYVIASDTRHDHLASIGQPSSLRDAPLGINPYRSLDAFDEESPDLFFGREALAGQLLRRLELLAKDDPDAPRLLAVMGPSGSGKPSGVHKTGSTSDQSAAKVLNFEG